MTLPIYSIITSILTTVLGISLGVLGIVVVSRLVGPLPLSVTQTTTQKRKLKVCLHSQECVWARS